jgi:hypothetical protein
MNKYVQQSPQNNAASTSTKACPSSTSSLFFKAGEAQAQCSSIITIFNHKKIIIKSERIHDTA